MKKLLYISFLFFIGVSCNNKSSLEEKKLVEEDTVYVGFPNDYKYTRAYRDSMDREIKAYSYSIYGDSNLLEEGLPDSMTLDN